jgi:cobyrinic acid a,c-diamide synthase
MDPITTAIVAALAAGVSSGVTEMGKRIIVDAYEALKAMLKKKLGEQSRVVKSVEFLEAEPGSQASKALVQEAVAASKAEQDPDILQAARILLTQIHTQPGGEQHIQTAIGSYIAQADRGSTATVNVTHPREP